MSAMTPPLLINFVYDNGTDIPGLVDAIKRQFETDETATVVRRGSESGAPGVSVAVRRAGGRMRWSFTGYGAERANSPSTVASVPSVEAEVSGPAFEMFDTEAQETVIHLVRTLAQTVTPHPRYTYGVDEGHAEIISTDGPAARPITPESLGDGTVNAVSWLMLFPPAFVESYGEAFLLDASAWRTTKFEDGAIMLVACPNLTDYGALDESLRELKAYFGTEHPRL